MKTKGLILNDSTVRSLKQYLKGFKDDAKIVIHIDYATYGVQIGCNFEYQKENNTVVLLRGEFISSP